MEINWDTYSKVDEALQRYGFDLDICQEVALGVAETREPHEVKLTFVYLRALRQQQERNAIDVEEIDEWQLLTPSTEELVELQQELESVVESLEQQVKSEELFLYLFDGEYRLHLSPSERKRIRQRVRRWRERYQAGQ